MKNFKDDVIKQLYNDSYNIISTKIKIEEDHLLFAKYYEDVIVIKKIRNDNSEKEVFSFEITTAYALKFFEELLNVMNLTLNNDIITEIRVSDDHKWWTINGEVSNDNITFHNEETVDGNVNKTCYVLFKNNDTTKTFFESIKKTLEYILLK
jgi:hypothetical protein